MDPNACLARIIDAAVAGHNLEMMDAARDLNDWLERHGFPPADPRNTGAAILETLGPDYSKLALLALRAGWLTPAEAAKLEPIAQEIADAIAVPLPDHRN